MPLEANILIERDSGKERCPPGTSPGQAQQARGDRLRKEQSDADLRQHDNRGDVSMTVGGVRGCPLRRGGDGRCEEMAALGRHDDAAEGRGIPPPPLKECFILKHDF